MLIMCHVSAHYFFYFLKFLLVFL